MQVRGVTVMNEQTDRAQLARSIREAERILENATEQARKWRRVEQMGRQIVDGLRQLQKQAATGSKHGGPPAGIDRLRLCDP